ncbi:MAG TPA: phenylalanine--tRNA ligase subunit beta [bacterium]|nr:phenylalanine--tRNA ligase subunit beta [bacterium]HOL35361.1 phenylalanine--tRNA ligase subunit beta [bacterium]HPP09197.1 phenylalanine--tRNA ligase subunit beta [bacterium]
MRYSIKALSEYIRGTWTKKDIKQWLSMLGLSLVFTEQDEDVLFEIEAPANRGDLSSAIGLIRALSPCGEIEPVYPDITIKEESSKILPIEIESFNDCIFYAGRVIESVKVTDSPQWLKEKVVAAGFRSVNNVVDITNLVFWEFGQPLHAFDLKCLKGKIVVRRAINGEQITTLDGMKRDLTSEVLVIADAEKPVAIAGIMGGMNSEVNSTTTDLFIESAFFNPVRIRRASKLLGLVTDASARFEKTIDPGFVVIGLNRCCRLISEICGGRVAPLCVSGDNQAKEKLITVRKTKIVSYLGCEIPEDFITSTLKKLNCEVHADAENLIVKVPAGRIDIEIDVDIIEEIAKYWGYDRIPEQMPISSIAYNVSSQEYLRLDALKDTFVKLGFCEVINLGLCDENRKISFSDDVIEIINPLSRNYAILRNSLIPELLQNLKDNYNRKIEKARIFEIGNVYFKTNSGFTEEPYAGAGVLNFGSFYAFKGNIEFVLGKIGYQKLVQKISLDRFGVFVEFLKDNRRVALIYLPDESILKEYDLEQQSVMLAEINLCDFVKNGFSQITYRPVSKLMPVKRDISLIVPNSVCWQKVEELIFRDFKIVEKLEIFDIYRGKNIPRDSTAVALTLTFSNPEGTLTRQEVEHIVQDILDVLKNHFSITLRQ